MIWIEKKKPRGWSVNMVSDIFKLLEGLPVQLRQLLENPDFSSKILKRLFPRAYEKDSTAEEEYQRLLRLDFVKQKLQGVECFEKTIAGRSDHPTEFGFSITQVDLGDEDLAIWLGFFHDVRLLIATRLGIEDESWEDAIDPASPEAKEYLLLHHLSMLEESIIQALRESEEI